MQTTLLLHGGRTKLKSPHNDAYFRELVKDLADGDSILFIGFARTDETERLTTFEREKALMQAQTNKKIKVVYATHDNFMQQLRAAKAVQICGGEIPDLMADLGRYPDFLDALRGKTVGGSSAGACLFATYYSSCESDMHVGKGLGVLPIRLLVHAGSREFFATDEALEILKTYPSNLELVTIPECEWVRRRVAL